MAMEFVMGTSLETLPKTIDFNFEELKMQLAEALELYKGLLVTEDGIKAAKEDRAKLNKLREALENKRKEVKKECMAPYMDFEAKVKELVGLIDQPIAAIDSQLQAFEEQRRAAKRAEIEGIYQETIGDLGGILPFERVWRDSWYNVGTSTKKIKDELTATISKVAGDLSALETVESEFMEPVKMKYLETLDLSAALAERQRLQEQAKRLREFEEQKKAATQEAAPSGHQIAGYVTLSDDVDLQPGEEPYIPEEPKKYRLCFECRVTTSQAAALSQFLKQANIEYRRI